MILAVAGDRAVLFLGFANDDWGSKREAFVWVMSGSPHDESLGTLWGSVVVGLVLFRLCIVGIWTW